METQLAFQLPIPAEKLYQREDFIVAPCNAEATAWVEQPDKWAAHALMIYGPAGCGKTHLSHRFGGLRLFAWSLGNRDISNSFLLNKIVLENVDRTRDETALFHFFNRTRELGIRVLMTAREIPDFKLPDLASRMSLIQKIKILPPDDDLIFMLLAKSFAQRGIHVDFNVLEYAVKQTKRTFSAIQDLIERADKVSLSSNHRITVPMIKQVLADLNSDKNT